MESGIREYRPEDRNGLEQCLLGLQDFVHNLDPLERLRGIHEFDVKAYTDVILNDVKQNDGVIFLGEVDGKIVGCIAGWIMKPWAHGSISHHDDKSGRVMELFVHADARGTGIGKSLMRTMEEYFRKHGCDSVRVDVFAPNKDAHAFYEKIGYHDRSIDMLKML